MNFKFARRLKIHFRKLPRLYHGRLDETDIWIDLDKNTNPARVFLHELLHYRYPKKSETQIRKLESKRWKRMSQRERYWLYRNLFLRKWSA